MEGNKANIKTISEITGFSPATVSNALNRKRGVKKETAEEIYKVAKDLGYIQNTSLSKVRFVVYRRPSSVFTDTPTFSKVLEGAEEICEEAGLEIMVNYLDMRLSSYENDLREMLDDRSSGIILIGSEIEEDQLFRFKKAKAPVVLLDHWHYDMDIECIANNGLESVRLLTEHLLEYGHTEIGYLRGDIRIFPFIEREAALVNTLRSHGLSLQEEYIFSVQTSIDGAYDSMKALLESHPKLPTAFVADNDIIALGCMRAMREAGIQLPQEVSIVAFDDLPMGEISSPRLTTIHTEMKEMGQLAMQKILARAKTPSRPKSKILLSTQFVQRDSVHNLNTGADKA